MCFSAKQSLTTFLIGTISSILLIYYGNPIFKKENITFGIFLIFISSIQLMDFFFWIDLHNIIGINKIFTIIGPLLNIGQPIILWAIKLWYFKPDIWNSGNLPVTILNGVYLFILFFNYVKYIREKQNNLVTTVKYGHLTWPWIKYSTIKNSNSYFYFILSAINIFYLTDFGYSLYFFLIFSLFLYLSMEFFKYNVGELWCFFGSFIPLIMLLSTKWL